MTTHPRLSRFLNEIPVTGVTFLINIKVATEARFRSSQKDSSSGQMAAPNRCRIVFSVEESKSKNQTFSITQTPSTSPGVRFKSTTSPSDTRRKGGHARFANRVSTVFLPSMIKLRYGSRRMARWSVNASSTSGLNCFFQKSFPASCFRRRSSIFSA